MHTFNCGSEVAIKLLAVLYWIYSPTYIIQICKIYDNVIFHEFASSNQKRTQCYIGVCYDHDEVFKFWEIDDSLGNIWMGARSIKSI